MTDLQPEAVLLSLSVRRVKAILINRSQPLYS